MQTPHASRIAKMLHDARTAAAAMLAALILIAAGLWLLAMPATRPIGWLLCALAALLVIPAFAEQQRREGEPIPAARPAPFAPAWRVALALLLILAGLGVAALALVNLATVNDHLQMRWWWLGSLVLLLAGSVVFGAVGGGRDRTEEGRQPILESLHAGSEEGAGPATADRVSFHLSFPLELLGFLLLMALAVWLRVYRISQMPPGIFVDETNAALDALRIMEGRPDSPFGTGWFETPTMYAFYLVALFRWLGTTFVAIKAASLIPAILTVAAMYPLARVLFGVPTAFAATFLLATSRWHITMSRWGWNEVAPLLFLVGALFFLLRGVRDRRASDFALGGLVLGLGHYTYLASRLLLVVVFLYLLYRIIGERGFLRRNWRGLVLFLLLYLVAFAPLLVTYAADPFTLLNRSQQVSIFNDMRAAYAQGQQPPAWLAAGLDALGLPSDVSLRPLAESITSHLGMFHLAGDRNPRHNLPGEPMLDPVTGGLLLLSLGYALWQALWPKGQAFREQDIGGGHRYALLLLWLTVPLLGGILTLVSEAPQAYRVLPVVGAVTLLAGDAAVRTARVLGSGLGAAWQSGRRGAPAVAAPRWTTALPAVAVAMLLLWAGVQNYRLFFQVQAQDGRVWQAFSPVETTVATEVAAKMDDHSLYLSPRLYHFSPLRFLAYRSPQQGGGGLDEPAYHLAEPATDLPVNDPFGQDALFLLDTYYQDVPELFLAYYPGTQFEMVDGPGGQPLYLSVTVPGDEIAALQGVDGTFDLGDGGAPIVRALPGALRWRWPADLAERAGAGASARWAGSLQVPASGLYDLHVEGPGRLLLDGVPWTGMRFLGKGLHAVEIEQIEGGVDAQVTLSWLTPGAQEFVPVPPNMVFRVQPPAHGLLAQYFVGELWEGEPAFQRVDPVLLFAWPEAEPWSAPFSVRWTGTLLAPFDGPYRFQLHADDGVRLWLDGDLVGESVVPDAVNLIDAELALAAGPHDVRIDFFQRGGGKALEFWWQLPGQQALQPVPPEALRPTSGATGG